MTLEGERVLLRPTTMEDLPYCRTWAADPEVMHYVLRRTFTHEEEEAWLQETLANPDELLFTIILKDTEKPVGTCGIHLVPGDAFAEGVSLGIMIGAKDEWGKGYGGEVVRLLAEHATEHLSAEKVWLTVDIDHERGRKAYEKAGFRITRNVKKRTDPLQRELYLMEWWP